LTKPVTLTRGSPQVAEVLAVGETDPLQLLQWAVSLETLSEHPLPAIEDKGRPRESDP